MSHRSENVWPPTRAFDVPAFIGTIPVTLHLTTDMIGQGLRCMIAIASLGEILSVEKSSGGTLIYGIMKSSTLEIMITKELITWSKTAKL